MINISLDSSEIINIKHLIENAIFVEKKSYNEMHRIEKERGYDEGTLTKYNARQIEEYIKIKKKLHDALYSNNA